MRMKKKQILALLLSLVLVLGLAIPAYAEEGTDGSSDITILYTNDVHTYINNKVITYSLVAGYRATLDNVLLVDAGDHIQGTAYGGLDNGATIVRLMNAAGYDLATLGNHEFDYGMEGALKTIENADYPYVSCNFYHESDGVQGENVLDSYKVFEFDGVKIALIGITTPESFTKSTPAYFQDGNGNYIYGIAGGTDGQALYQAVQTAIDSASEEADIVIALGHLGIDASSSPWTSREVIANTTGLDAFIDGHSHSTVPEEIVNDKDGNSVVLTQTGCYLGTLGQMMIGENEDGTYSISTKLLSADDLADVTPDAAVKTIEDEWIRSVNTQLGAKIAESSIEFTINDAERNRQVRKGETNLGDLNADAYYWYANEVANIPCDVAIMNGGGIRASVPAGDWTYETTKTVNTFGNVLCIVEVTGQNILDALEFGARFTPDSENGGFLHTAGLTYKVDTSVENTVQTDDKNVWQSGPTEYRVYDVQVYNKETGTYEDLDVNKVYRLAGTNYTLRNCGDGFNMFGDSYLVLEGIAEDYLAMAAYVSAFADTDNNRYADIASANSPLTKYTGYMLNYEDPVGAGRIYIASGKEDALVSVSVDGTIIDSSNYTIGEDGAVSLTEDYLATLPAGTHTLTTSYKYSTDKSTTFVVEAAVTEEPKTDEPKTEDPKIEEPGSETPSATGNDKTETKATEKTATTAKAAKTADNNEMALYLILLMMAGGTVVIASKKRQAR